MRCDNTETYLCSDCPRRCGALRGGTGGGFCGMPADPVIARAALHMWEEPCISGKRGTGAVFFSGCNLRCRFCQNIAVFHQGSVIQRGSHEELVADEKGKYFELWQAQAQYYQA